MHQNASVLEDSGESRCSPGAGTQAQVCPTSRLRQKYLLKDPAAAPRLAAVFAGRWVKHCECHFVEISGLPLETVWFLSLLYPCGANEADREGCACRPRSQERAELSSHSSDGPWSPQLTPGCPRPPGPAPSESAELGVLALLPGRDPAAGVGVHPFSAFTESR